MSVFVVRAFVRLRKAAARHAERAEKVTALEQKVGRHDKALSRVIDAARGLLLSPPRAVRPIGLRAGATAEHRRTGR